MLSERLFLGVGAVFGFLGVAAGAFGAHALRERIDVRMFEIFETAARYQLLHALALLAAAWVCARYAGALPVAAGWLFTAGVAVFSGSLYLLVFSGARAWGAVTPLGGLLLLAGWACLAATAFLSHRLS